MGLAYRLAAYRLWDRHGCIDLQCSFCLSPLFQSIFLGPAGCPLAWLAEILGRDEGLMDQIRSSLL